MAFGGQTGGATHRYGLVLVATVIVVVVGIGLPDDHVGQGISLVLQAVLLILITSASRDVTSRVLTGLATAAGVLGLVSAFWDVLPSWLAGTMSTLLALAMAANLLRGVGALLRTEGVTPQAIAGGLSLYLLLGLLFAQAISAVAGAGSTDYFAQGTDGTPGQRIYFSFTALTTTGFGDLSAGTDVGRAIAVLEMLIGQIYLVTVVSLLVGNLRRGDRLPPPPRTP
jgi:hypothetical protein